MNNPITENLPADLPEDWTIDMFISPEGPYVGLAEQYGYIYLMKCVNAAQRAAKQLGEALAAAKAVDFGAIPSTEKGQANGVAELDSSGKVPSAQLPAMNYDPAGSAQAVQTNLTSHINNKSNPHSTTAELVGAYSKSQTLTSATAQLFGLAGNANPDDVFEEINQLLSDKVQRVFGSYVGTGVYGEEHPNHLSFEDPPVFVLLFTPGQSRRMFIPGSVDGTAYYSGETDSYFSNQYTWDESGKNLSWFCDYGGSAGGGSDSNASAAGQMNAQKTYEYVAFI